jgi:hypothetical protein
MNAKRNKKNLDYLERLTKEEADFISHVLKWDDEQKIAFNIAKKIFDENIKKSKGKNE